MLKAIIFGPYGVGKTSLLGTAQEDSRMMPAALLNFEGGTMSIASRTRDLTIDEFTATDFKPSDTVLDSVSIHSWTHLERCLDKLYEDGTPYKSVLVDSLTEINYLSLRRAVRQNYEKKIKGCDGEVATLPDFLRSSTSMREMFRNFRDLPMHTIFTALTKDHKDEKSGVLERGPALVGQLQQELPGMVDIVGYMYLGTNKERILRFAQTEMIKSKDRSEGGKLGDTITTITLRNILDLLGE